VWTQNSGLKRRTIKKLQQIDKVLNGSFISKNDMAKRNFQGKTVSNLCDPSGIFEIESLSMSLEVTLDSFSISKVLFVQLTGTRIAHARRAIGTKILSLHE
jgi:hypothetical protein